MTSKCSFPSPDFLRPPDCQNNCNQWEDTQE
jgi:hypothetical protein